MSCMRCLCILEINPLSVVSVAIIFSHSEGCLFTLFIVSFEKEMATHSSILAWRIPWTEEPGELQSMGSQKVSQLKASAQQRKI